LIPLIKYGIGQNGAIGYVVAEVKLSNFQELLVIQMGTGLK
jgi:hypothetical protein